MLDVATDNQGHITEVSLKEDSPANSHVLVRYTYNKENDIEVITDAAGLDTCLKYRNHLLIKKTDRNEHSFYWEYDKYEDGARALRTWGDEGLLSLWIDYHDEGRYNTVRTNRTSAPSEYYYNEKMLCTRIVHPDLTETRETYNDKYQLVSQVDEEGRFTLYQYNDQSQITTVTRADASKILFSYDESGRLVEMTNPEGTRRKWIYNDDDTLDKVVDEGGMETAYQYNKYRLVEKAVYANKAEIHFEYDRHLNLSKVMLADGSFSSWEYDGRGNCLAATNALGAVETYRYDKLNRLVGAKLADGNEVQFAYDGYENVLHAKDRQTEVDFTYTVLGSLASRMQGGHKAIYDYNGQGELISVTNEKGEIYRFERDVKGNIIKEEGYDHIIRTYERDYSGLVTKINRPGGRFTRYSHDKLGRVVRADYHDGSHETFTYNKNGALVETENQHTKVKLERNQTGRVTREWQDFHWICGKYDELGNRIQVTSSFGANILTERNEMGQATHLVAYLNEEKPWEARMEYNALGQETQRLCSGGVRSSWEYDFIGRPVFHEVSVQEADDGKQHHHTTHTKGGAETLRQRRYEWDVNYRLKKITNELNQGTTVFSYDQFSNLVSAKESGVEAIFRTMDCVGNLYETSDQSDRIYGAGSRLERSVINLNEKRNRYQGGQGKLVTKGFSFCYDEEGNLAKKIEPNGDIWSYTYYGNGMLKEVIRPDRSNVRFKYDPFGRRIEKTVSAVYGDKIPQKKQGKTVRFLWDGNVLLHEWEEDAASGSQIPEAKVIYRADYVLELEREEEEKAREEVQNGKRPPESLITWVFQDDFIPRGKITKEGNYSIISDYLGTPVEAYNETGEKVWEQELDIYGRVKSRKKNTQGRIEREAGEGNFIPFRFQGQYEDEEIGLYYNRFRYYSPEDGCYTQQDPIKLAGGNPTLYGYVSDTNSCIDFWGLANSIPFVDFNKAMNAALKWLEERGFKAQIPNIIKFGDRAGYPNGMKTFDGKIGFRVEYDESFGAHINVWNGKEKGPHFQFPADKETVDKIQGHYCKG